MSDREYHAPPEPTEAVNFFKRKKVVPEDAWDTYKQGEHSHIFTVAHSTEANINDDVAGNIHKVLDQALREGHGFGDVREQFLDLMEKAGWYGKEGKENDKDYINWRIRTIYETNMRTAYSAQAYQKQLETAALRPIWVYHSLMFGDNRREEHKALNDKAFRYDDPFWDTYYPPNGWGCECYVTSESEYEAKNNGREVCSSGEDGEEPDIPGVDWDKFDPTWKYNSGREALAPNFNRYEHLPEDTLKDIYAAYRNTMDNTRLTEGEFKILLRRTNEADYKPLNINYQVGNLEEKRFAAMRQAGVTDSKIMATDHDLWHSTGNKNAKQKVPESLFNDLYDTLQEPEAIFQEKVPLKSKQEKIVHLVKTDKSGKKIKIVVHVRTLKNGQTSMQVRTLGYTDYDYTGDNYKKIEW